MVSKSKRINYVRLLPIKISYNRRVQDFSLYPPRGGDVRLLSESPRWLYNSNQPTVVPKRVPWRQEVFVHKGNNYESDENNRKKPYWVSCMSRMVSTKNRCWSWQKPLYHQKRAAWAQAWQRQGIRMLKQNLRPLWRMPTQDIHLPQRSSAEKFCWMLWILSSFQGSGMSQP